MGAECRTPKAIEQGKSSEIPDWKNENGKVIE